MSKENGWKFRRFRTWVHCWMFVRSKTRIGSIDDSMLLFDAIILAIQTFECRGYGPPLSRLGFFEKLLCRFKQLLNILLTQQSLGLLSFCAERNRIHRNKRMVRNDVDS